MKIFNYTITIQKTSPDQEVLNGIRNNAIRGLAKAQIELDLHNYLLETADETVTEDEIKGYETAIENDLRSIRNWEAQLAVTSK